VTEPAVAESLEAAGVLIRRIPVGPHKANAYLVRRSEARDGVVIDPGASADDLIEEAAALELDVKAILLTHAHWDHVGATDALAREFDAPVYLHADDRRLLKAAPIYAFRVDAVRLKVPAQTINIDDGAKIDAGSLSIAAIHLPGHTAGGVAFRIGRALFTGDTLLPGAAGRVDLPDSDKDAMKRSLSKLRDELMEGDVICPGHGALWPHNDALAWLTSHTEEN